MGLGDSFKILFLFTFLFLNFVAAQTVPRLSSVAEWRALMELRSSLGIRAIDWHKKANPCLNWTGIRCNNGHITRINLSGLRRNPEAKLNPRFAVDALPNFSSLSVFNSSGFSLGGSIPEWLGRRLSNLTVLDLSSSSIDGPIPSSFGSLSRLSSLCLSNNSLAGIIPTELGNLSALSVLDLSQNSLTGQIPNKISVLGNLSKLDLSSNFLSGPIPVGFSSLSSLKLLSLSKNSLSASIPAQLGNLTQLSELDLRYNSFSGSLPNELGGLRSLRKMMVGNNVLEGSLPDALFQELNRLEYLVLNGNNFVGRLPNAIWSMASLNYLDFSQNNLTGVFPSHVSSFNVTDAVFNFSYNLFYGNLSSTIRNFRIIDLSSNYFEGSAPTYTRGSIILSNNCFSNVPNQRNSVACQEFYSERATPSGDNPIQPRKSRNKLVYVMIGTFGGLGLIIVVIAAISLLLRTCNIGSTNQERGNSRTEPPPRVLANLSSMGQLFTHEQIKLATSSFSNENLIKHGHSGDLFRGTLEGGQIVIVKKVNMNSSRKESFMCELDMFGKVSHPRLVPLVGHCLDDENEKMLVYKYMPNGDLSNSLYRLANGEEEEEQMQSLDWITRLKIAIGAAEVLSYLHQECTPPIVHRDIQASSILLDDKYEVRLGSLSEVRAAGANNHHNMISRLLTPQTSRKRPSGKSSVSCAYDVYCFGKVLLELVTGRLGISSSSNEADAKQWLDTNLQFITIHNKELMIKIVDQSLIIDEDLLEEIWAVAIVARSCLNPKASRRPSMMHVLKALENPFKVVRDEKFNSDRLRTVSSIQSWTNVFFGSWHRSSSGSSSVSGPTSREIIGGARQVGSRSSGANDHSSSHKRSSSDVFPEPKDMQDLERQMDTT